MSDAEREQARAIICRLDGHHKLDKSYECIYCGVSNSDAFARGEPYQYLVGINAGRVITPYVRR